MAQAATVPFLTQFAMLRDPRQAGKVLYPLPELLLLLLCGTVAGADDFVELTLWGEENLAFLRRFLPFAHVIPSHDTLCEVIAAIDPGLFKTCFTNWIASCFVCTCASSTHWPPLWPRSTRRWTAISTLSARRSACCGPFPASVT